MLHRLRVIEEINVSKNKNSLEVPSSELIEAYMCSYIFKLQP